MAQNCATHAWRRQVVEDAEAGADVEIDAGDEQPEHDLGQLERVGPEDHDRGHRAESNAAAEEDHHAARVVHERASQQPGRADGGGDAAPEMRRAGDVARLAEA